MLRRGKEMKKIGELKVLLRSWQDMTIQWMDGWMDGIKRQQSTNE